MIRPIWQATPVPSGYLIMAEAFNDGRLVRRPVPDPARDRDTLLCTKRIRNVVELPSAIAAMTRDMTRLIANHQEPTP